ncbi:alpha/beta fold hydrolase [Marivita hallyeonensis]|nr:alpha/beta fold hydrolase [Marivita hallyeonensis]
MGWAFLFLFALVATGAAFLWLKSPGTIPPLRDARGAQIPGSISERVTVEIGGVPQGMIIQSVDPSNPVLLFLHGGPGMPEFFLQNTHPTGLEQDFTVVWWEQRGAGISWSPDLDPGDLTIDRLILDTIEVADFLRARFGQDRILLLGHSWGSFLGLQVAARAPDRFTSYVGMAQVAHQLRSEIMAREVMIAAYRQRGDSGMVRRLEDASVSMETGMSNAYLRLRDAATHRLGGGTTRDMTSVITGVFLPVMGLPVYTLREKIGLWRGKAWSRGLLWEEILRTDLGEQVERLEIPMHFFIGAHDLTAAPALSRELYDHLDAPERQYHVFENSAHSPLFEEPDRAREILRSIAASAR